MSVRGGPAPVRRIGSGPPDYASPPTSGPVARNAVHIRAVGAQVRGGVFPRPSLAQRSVGIKERSPELTFWLKKTWLKQLLSKSVDQDRVGHREARLASLKHRAGTRRAGADCFGRRALAIFTTLGAQGAFKEGATITNAHARMLGLLMSRRDTMAQDRAARTFVRGPFSQIQRSVAPWATPQGAALGRVAYSDTAAQTSSAELASRL